MMGPDPGNNWVTGRQYGVNLYLKQYYKDWYGGANVSLELRTALNYRELLKYP